MSHDPQHADRTEVLHPATTAILRFFDYDHLPAELQEVSRPFSELAQRCASLYEGAELTTGLRKLLEAKDCIVRAALTSDRAQDRTFSVGGDGQPRCVCAIGFGHVVDPACPIHGRRDPAHTITGPRQ